MSLALVGRCISRKRGAHEQSPDESIADVVESLRAVPRASAMALSPNKASFPEMRLLVCCAHPQLQPAVAEEIRNLSRGPIDWDVLLSKAAEHSVTSPLCRRLPAAAGDLIELARIEQLKEIERAIAMRALVHAAELVRIMNQFRSEGIQAIPYKGPVLAVQAYGDVGFREFEDLDIVLRDRDIPAANDAMTSLGYNPKFPALSSGTPASIVPAEYMYIHQDESRQLLVELHTERTLRHLPLRLDLDDFASRLVPVSIGGHELLTFAPEDTFVLLCIHCSKHFWDRLVWIADIAAFAHSHAALDWDLIFRRAQSLRANRMVAISLELALRLFDLPLPRDVDARVRCDSVAKSIAAEIERRLLARQPDELGAVARFHLRRHMLEGFGEGWRYSLRLATLPSDDDWSAVKLPPFLAPLYPALRPFRLLRKYGAAGGNSPRESFASRKASN